MGSWIASALLLVNARINRRQAVESGALGGRHTKAHLKHRNREANKAS